MRKMTLEGYIYECYTKFEFPRVEIAHEFAKRAADAIRECDMRRLTEPFTIHLYSGKYEYDEEAVRAECCRLGLDNFVAYMISVVDMLQSEQFSEMLEKVTQEENIQKELRMRVAAVIALYNPCFLNGDLGMIRNAELQEMLVSSGISGFIHMVVSA